MKIRLCIMAVSLLLSASCAPAPKLSPEEKTLQNTLANMAKNPDLALVMGTSEIRDFSLFGETGSPAMITLASKTVSAGMPEYNILCRSPLARCDLAPPLLRTQYFFPHHAGLLPVGYALSKVQSGTSSYLIAGWDSPSPITVNPQPGEVIYIGHIIFQPHLHLYDRTQSYMGITVEDRYDEWLKKTPLPPQLQQKVVKRLLQAPAKIELRNEPDTTQYP